MRVGVIGAGAVGAASLLSLVMRGPPACEIVVLDKNYARAKGVVADLQYGATLSPAVELCTGDYPDLADAVLTIVTAGINERAGSATDRSDSAGRLKLLDANANAYRDIVPRIVAVAPQAVILVVTDPPDPLADLARRLAGHERVLSSGTFLDTLRFTRGERLPAARRQGGGFAIQRCAVPIAHSDAPCGVGLGSHGRESLLSFAAPESYATAIRFA
jgi:L-lactate dehydrogenase